MAWIVGIMTIFVAGIEAIRIAISWGKKQNINHWISVSIELLTAAIIYLIYKPNIWLYILLCFSWRLILYSIALNTFRGKALDYQGTKTTSWIDQKLPFWNQRCIGIGLFILYILINKGL